MANKKIIIIIIISLLYKTLNRVLSYKKEVIA